MRHDALSIAKLPRPHGHQAVWDAVRALKKDFCLKDVWQFANKGQRGIETERTTARDYLIALEKAGILVAEQNASNKSHRRYSLAIDKGKSYPRVDKNGVFLESHDGVTRMWLSMNVLQTFTAKELSYTAEVAENTAKSYVTMLIKAGYICVQTPSRPGTPAVYHYLRRKRTGPLAPQIQRIKAVFDPNTNEVVWAKRDGAGEKEHVPQNDRH